MTHKATSGILQSADNVVNAAGYAVSGGKRARSTLHWLASHGYEELAWNAIVVTTDKDEVSSRVDKDAIEEYLAGICRELIAVPHGRGVADGDLVPWTCSSPRLAVPTKQSWTGTGRVTACTDLDQTLAAPAANAEPPGVAWAHQGRTSEGVAGMTITEYAAALGGMLAQLAGMGLLAAGLIKAKARQKVLLRMRCDLSSAPRRLEATGGSGGEGSGSDWIAVAPRHR
ncbi:hypothetical protein [Pseudarthrobacter sp. GA104]|uniref:hypothetical protein n=1 Tax=Pseudarthrobacter sp. GA104 TaxID=2676311 RepID=UPI001E621BE1|nr:hypothetical protein [Pseudarthrobacter sp. GA104]